MDTEEIYEWWEETDGEGDDEEYPHHPAEVYETQWGIGVVLRLPYSEDGDYQTEDSEINPDYLKAVEHTLGLFYEAYPELKGKTRVAIDFDSGSDGEVRVKDEKAWTGETEIILCND